MARAKAESGVGWSTVQLEGGHSCLPAAREWAMAKRNAGWPRQGNHETDERNAASRRVGVDGGISIVIGCHGGAQARRRGCLALFPPMLLFAREAWAKGQCRFAILPISNLSRFAQPIFLRSVR